ncbi:hypothetical protein FIBSPDRAFT_964536 [Athelia psychrophila]|uniref:Uncharacterized protein n=1 Tax=Athelia psychrophila TaxID=1759441 RepID=A0A165XNF9_9AGAM|nr:hypothetical protein FIBSPDRAFT_964536 [Fibularhizoctonia sp. CBS 109695]
MSTQQTLSLDPKGEWNALRPAILRIIQMVYRECSPDGHQPKDLDRQWIVPSLTYQTSINDTHTQPGVILLALKDGEIGQRKALHFTIDLGEMKIHDELKNAQCPLADSVRADSEFVRSHIYEKSNAPLAEKQKRIEEEILQAAAIEKARLLQAAAIEKEARLVRHQPLPSTP